MEMIYVLVNNYKCINRTFMELKLIKLGLSPATSKRINRTFMELKLDNCCVLTSSLEYQSNLYGIETVDFLRYLILNLSINRTFMELKLRQII